jgi:hypothetical protein
MASPIKALQLYIKYLQAEKYIDLNCKKYSLYKTSETCPIPFIEYVVGGYSKVP